MKLEFLVPDSSVAAVIGKQGQNVRRINEDNAIVMSVEGRIDKFEYRVVKMEGEKEGIMKGITEVLKVVHEMQGRV